MEGRIFSGPQAERLESFLRKLIPSWGVATYDPSQELRTVKALKATARRLPFVSQFTQKTRSLTDPNLPIAQALQRVGKSFRAVTYRIQTSKKLPEKREKVVVLGTGWSSLYLLHQIDPTKFDVTVISPRSFFVFTPLLTAALSGTLSIRSVMEPIRNKMFFAGRKVMEYLDGRAEDVDLDSKSVVCRDKSGNVFKVAFDKLVLAVGSETNTFGIPGVKEYASFLKEVEDVREIRLKLFGCFEKAALPSMTDKQRKDMLNFVVVGGGPAGVEAAAEMMDMMHEDLKKHYPSLVKLAQVTVVEMLPGLIPMFGKEVSAFAGKTFNEIGVTCLMEHRVTKIDDKNVYVVDKNKNAKAVPYGSVIWASGLGQVDLAKTLIEKIPQQNGNRVLRVRPDLRLIGGENVYALGDCAYVTPPQLADKAEELYTKASSSPFGAGGEWLRKNVVELLKESFVQVHPTQCDWELYRYKNRLGLEEFTKLLQSIDKAYNAPVPTAQMARQAGAYLGASLNRNGSYRPKLPFAPTTYGAFSYVGGGKAVVELTRERNVPKPRVVRFMGGLLANNLWRGYYWVSQTSKYNRILSATDYAKVSLKGRDVTEQTLKSTSERQRAGSPKND